MMKMRDGRAVPPDLYSLNSLKPGTLSLVFSVCAR